MKLFVLVLVLFSLITVKGEEVDPCDVDNYPIIWQKDLTPSHRYDLPAIYHQQNGIQSIVSVKDAINITQQQLNDHKPFLNNAKQHILNTLSNIKHKKLVNVEQLKIDMEGLQKEQLNVAIHVMAGYHFLFVHALMNNIASMKVDGALRTSATAIFQQGTYKEKDQSESTVNRLLIKQRDKIALRNCSFL